MKRRITIFLMLLLGVGFALALACLRAQAQSGQTFQQRQYYASDYGTWTIQGQYPNTYLWSPSGVCKIPDPTIGSFLPFNTNAPLFIRDSVSSASEVVSPNGVIATDSYCGVTIMPAHQHTSFALLSGTAGLQEVLNQIAGTIPYAVQVVLDRNWYTLLGSIPGQSAATVIGAVHGSTAVNLVDVTKAPSAYYHWNGSAYAVVGATKTCTGEPVVVNGIVISC